MMIYVELFEMNSNKNWLIYLAWCIKKLRTVGMWSKGRGVGGGGGGVERVMDFAF